MAAKWTVFTTIEGGALNRDVSNAEAGFDSRRINLLMGSTYALNTSHTLGALVSTIRQVGDYLGGGDFSERSNGWRVLELYQPSVEFFIQAVAGVDAVASQRTRTTSFEEYFNGALAFYQSGTPSADYHYKQSELSLQSGYSFYRGRYTLTPQLGLSAVTSAYGSYTESGNSGLELKFHNDKRKSLLSTLGLQATRTISTGVGVVTPQFDLNWKHKFADKSRQVEVSFVDDTRSKIFRYDTQAADRDFIELGGGVVIVFINGVQSFVRLQTSLGQRYTQSTIATLGLNIEL